MPAYNWDEIPGELARPGIRRRGFGTKDMMVVRNECQPGLEVRPHSHAFGKIAMVTKGRAVYYLDDEPYQVGPDSVILIPAGAVHYFEPLGDEVFEIIDVFAPAREDYLHLLDWSEPQPTRQ
jgi:quercetin dioxygenase-like cupin family protein